MNKNNIYVLNTQFSLDNEFKNIIIFDYFKEDNTEG